MKVPAPAISIFYREGGFGQGGKWRIPRARGYVLYAFPDTGLKATKLGSGSASARVTEETKAGDTINSWHKKQSTSRELGAVSAICR